MVDEIPTVQQSGFVQATWKSRGSNFSPDSLRCGLRFSIAGFPTGRTFMNDVELWKPVVGHEGRYEVSSFGRVKSLARIESKINQGKVVNFPVRERILRPTLSVGYPKVVLYVNGRKTDALIHRIEAECFIPNPEHKREVNHKDMNRVNNMLENLEWTTPSENKNHARRLGRYVPLRGEKHVRARLTEAQVRQIRRIRKSPNPPSYESLAKTFRVGHSTVSAVALNQIWRHIK